MHRLNMLEAGLAQFDLDEIAELSDSCRPRLLIVIDGELNFKRELSLGLWRFLHAIITTSGVTEKPRVTLAHRGKAVHDPIDIDGDSYSVESSFTFTTKDFPQDDPTSKYDQLWLFGHTGQKDGDQDISPDEISVISNFMTAGGGIFATGDHGKMGKNLCGSLPRISLMREWEKIPMGTEIEIGDAIKRIDTVVNPGANNIFDFSDQSDNIPQRIYPNYTVKGPTPIFRWEATVHRLLELPCAPKSRNNFMGASGFKCDIDVLPDHPHESVCLTVTDDEKLKRTFDVNKTTIPEFPHSVKEPNTRVIPEIVAFAVSGGRSVFNNAVWKPPVTPQMFGAISAYEGHLAQPSEIEGQPPGNIVCDSTWHHFVNVNLDGTGAICYDAQNKPILCSGLGSWSGVPGKSIFTPSPDLEKIYCYYRNLIRWLQPANRTICNLWWSMTAARYQPMISEELLEAPRLIKEALEGSKSKALFGFVGLGSDVSNLFGSTKGSQYLLEMSKRILLSKRSPEALKAISLFDDDEVRQTYFNSEIFLDGLAGFTLALLAELLPADDPKRALRILREGCEKNLTKLLCATPEFFELAFSDHSERLTRTNNLTNGLNTLKNELTALFNIQK